MGSLVFPPPDSWDQIDSDVDLLVLEHTLDERIHILEVDVLGVLTERNSKPIRRRITWLGHKAQSVKLFRTVDGRGLLSVGCPGDAIAWALDNNGAIRQRAVLPFEFSCLCLTLLAGKLCLFEYDLICTGKYCLALYPGTLELWCTTSSPATKVYSIPVQANGKFLCFVQLPRATNDSETRKFLAITDAKESFAWCVDFSAIYVMDKPARKDLTIELLRQGPFPSDDDLHLVSVVDPMGWRAMINSESLDMYTREVLVTVSRGGRLQTWTTNPSRQSATLTWLNLSAIPTNITEASLVHGTSERKVAMGEISRRL